MTFHQLRNDAGRQHLRCSDLIEAAAALGCRMTRYQVRVAIADVPRPTVKRYGHWHYGSEHLKAVVRVAKRRARP